MKKHVLNRYEAAIVRNAGWFGAHQDKQGYIDIDGDEFYGVRGDATLVGHSVTVRMYAHHLTDDEAYLRSACASLDWLARRQDDQGGWRGHSAFTLDGAQCVFEGFNAYQSMSGDRRFESVLVRAADRMISGTIDDRGRLLLPNIIEIGEYAHFAFLAWKTTGRERFRKAGEAILTHIERNFDEGEGFWRPYDAQAINRIWPLRLLRPVMRAMATHAPMRGAFMARLSEHLTPLVVADSFPQYALSLMDSEALLDTLDGACSFPKLREQTQKAVEWAQSACAGPFPGCLVESRKLDGRAPVYPVPIINDAELAALWPTTCLLLAYCGLNDRRYGDAARQTAEWILSVQDKDGGFYNFQHPGGAMKPLRSGNVNYYACLALWHFTKVYGETRAP